MGFCQCSLGLFAFLLFVCCRRRSRLGRRPGFRVEYFLSSDSGLTCVFAKTSPIGFADADADADAPAAAAVVRVGG